MSGPQKPFKMSDAKKADRGNGSVGNPELRSIFKENKPITLDTIEKIKSFRIQNNDDYLITAQMSYTLTCSLLQYRLDNTPEEILEIMDRKRR